MFFKKKKLTTEEKILKLFKNFFYHFEYSKIVQISQGYYQITNSGIVIIDNKKKIKLELEDIEYIYNKIKGFEIQDCKQERIMENLLEDLQKYIQDMKEYKEVRSFALSKQELNFLCDKILRPYVFK